MVSYIQQLEQQNEQLKECLAKTESLLSAFKPYWKSISNGDIHCFVLDFCLGHISKRHSFGNKVKCWYFSPKIEFGVNEFFSSPEEAQEKIEKLFMEYALNRIKNG